jgi:hypothetical protein
MKGSTLSLEERDGQQIISQVLLSSGKGNKIGGMLTLLPVEAARVEKVKGALRLVPLKKGQWPSLFRDLLAFESE